jgi:outer membrane lipopolysaccharide assembly protein LptE/RlpB
MRPSGVRSAALGLVLVFLLAGCFYGFAGGGLPSSIRTVAVLPFENETPSSELQRELLEQLRRDLQSRLNLRDAPESRADAVVRGTIARYETDIPVSFSSDPRQATSARRRLQLTVDVEIVEQSTGRVLWQRKGLIGEGEYAERAEQQGRRTAMERIAAEIIEGAQSQW